MLTLNNVNYGDKIAVAVSGGVDSVVLLHALNERKTALNLTLYAVNIDHSIRGKDSENDSLFVKNYCEKLGVSLYFEKVDAVEFSKTNKLSLENGARVLRYEVFNKFLQTYSGFKIATAHHKNDLFESAVDLVPTIKNNLFALEKAGAPKVLLAGSGPTVYGLFFDKKERDNAYKKLKGLYGDDLIKAKTVVPNKSDDKKEQLSNN